MRLLRSWARRTPHEGAAARFACTGRPEAGTRWREAGWCAVDLELTGLEPAKDEVIAIGAVPIEDGRVVLGKSFYTLVRTTRRSEHGAILAHKLRVADLADAPPLDRAIDSLLDVLAGRIPVFHTGAVEQSFLSPLFGARRLRLPEAADTDVLGRLWLRERGDNPPTWLPLAALSKLLGQQAEQQHHALGDALTTAKAFVALASHLDVATPQTVGSLTRAGDAVRGARRLG
jgi:DNA polymerase-3 subunit epsilon